MKTFKTALVFVSMMSLSLIGNTQDAPTKDNRTGNRVAHSKGKFYAFWGWNLAAYSNSDIRFKGDDYDFKLYDVKASDRQNKISYHDYLQIDRITIPQTNFRIGYFVKDNFAITIGVDHMKYVMNQNQTVDASGYIHRAGYEDRLAGGGVKLTEDFLTFEHTDGLNYINTEAEYYYNAYQKGILKLNVLVGAGFGFLLPKTNAQLLGFERHDNFHLAGWGMGAKLGGEVLLWDLFFIRTEGKQGYINMGSIRTTGSSADKASQHFWFAQFNYTLGFSWKF